MSSSLNWFFFFTFGGEFWLVSCFSCITVAVLGHQLDIITAEESFLVALLNWNMVNVGLTVSCVGCLGSLRGSVKNWCPGCRRVKSGYHDALKSKHYLNLLLPFRFMGVSGAHVQESLSEGLGTSWTGLQSIKGQHIDKQPFALFTKGQFRVTKLGFNPATFFLRGNSSYKRCIRPTCSKINSKIKILILCPFR